MNYIESYNTFTTESVYNKATRTEKLSMGEIVAIFNDKCSDWDIENTNQIWRSSWEAHNLFYINPKKHEYRDSPNSEGFYHSLLPNLESWKFAPKRTESLIMSTSYKSATNFNNESPHLMIPFNNSNIGMAPEQDLWISGDRIRKILNTYNISWGDYIEPEIINFLKNNLSDKYIIEKTRKYGKDTYIKNIFFREKFNEKTVIDMINYIDNIPKNELKTKWIRYSSKTKEYDYEIINIWLNKYKSLKFSEFLSYFFDFYSNGFKIIRKQNELEINVEVWSSGEFLGIHESLIEEFKQKVKLSHS